MLQFARPGLASLRRQASFFANLAGLLAASLILPSPLALAAKMTVAAAWMGNDFSDKEGATTFSLALPAAFENSSKSTLIQFLMVDLLHKKKLVIKATQKQFASPQRRPFWTLPAGKYALIAVRLQTARRAKGEKVSPPLLLWKAAAKEAPRFVVKRLGISHLGAWKLSLGPHPSLDLELTPPSLQDATLVAEGRKYPVYHGLNGSLLVAGTLIEASQAASLPNSNPSEGSTASKKLYTLHIKWRLELMKDRELAAELEKALKQRDVEIRACYTSQLEKKPGLAGDLQFLVAISKKTGRLQKIKAAGGKLAEPNMVQCLTDQLAKVKFTVNRNTVGKLIFNFEVS